jgi:oxygen-dependent protoporphyrinogen oxidase
MTADVVVLCLPAFAMVQVLSEEFVELGNALKNINYPPMSIVHSAFKKEDVSFPMNGFGGLNPKIANKFSAGSIWTSTIFPERTKEQTILFTTFVGGAQYKENAELGESEVKQRVNDELKSDFKIKSNAIFQHYYFWQKSIPQYDESMRKARSLLEEYENENLYVCSNIFDGISMPDCIKKGKTLAKKLSKLSEN